MAVNRTITLKGDPIVEDIVCSEIVSPGHLLEIRATGVELHDNGGAGDALNAAPMFALERDEIGSTTTDAYASGDTVKVGMFGVGMRVHARLAASASAIVVGDYLESDGDGTLRILTADAATTEAFRRSVVAVAREAVDNSMGGAEVFIDVQIV